MFHVFGQTFPYDWLAQNFELLSWTLSIVQSFIVFGIGVWIFLWKGGRILTIHIGLRCRR